MTPRREPVRFSAAAQDCTDVAAENCTLDDLAAAELEGSGPGVRPDQVKTD
jgi:hypothetical protein